MLQSNQRATCFCSSIQFVQIPTQLINLCYFRFESESDLLAHIQAVEDEDQTKPETNKLDDDAAKPKSSLQQDGSKPESSKQKDGFKQEKITQPDKEIVKCSRFKDLNFYHSFKKMYYFVNM